MVVKRFAMLLLIAAGLSGCGDKRGEHCERFPDVCEVLDREDPALVIVTTSLKADKSAFREWLTNEGIDILLEFEVTDQVLVEITTEQFHALAERQDVEKIQKDKQYLR